MVLTYGGGRPVDRPGDVDAAPGLLRAQGALESPGGIEAWRQLEQVQADEVGVTRADDLGERRRDLGAQRIGVGLPKEAQATPARPALA